MCCRAVDAGTVTLESALQLLQYPMTLGEHPEGGPVTLHNGPYSFYVQHNGTNASVPKVML